MRRAGGVAPDLDRQGAAAAEVPGRTPGEGAAGPRQARRQGPARHAQRPGYRARAAQGAGAHRRRAGVGVRPGERQRPGAGLREPGRAAHDALEREVAARGMDDQVAHRRLGLVGVPARERGGEAPLVGEVAFDALAVGIGQRATDHDDLGQRAGIDRGPASAVAPCQPLRAGIVERGSCAGDAVCNRPVAPGLQGRTVLGERTQVEIPISHAETGEIAGRRRAIGRAQLMAASHME